MECENCDTIIFLSTETQHRKTTQTIKNLRGPLGKVLTSTRSAFEKYSSQKDLKDTVSKSQFLWLLDETQALGRDQSQTKLSYAHSNLRSPGKTEDC